MKLNKKSKLKRIGIKSFLYEVIDNNYKVYFFSNRDQSSRGDIIYKTKELNANTLVNKDDFDIKGICLNINNLNTKFIKGDLKSSITRLPSNSNVFNRCLIEKYASNKMNLSDSLNDNNIIRQIIHNYEDIRKIISIYLNDLILSICSYDEIQFNDFIGTIQTNDNFEIALSTKYEKITNTINVTNSYLLRRGVNLNKSIQYKKLIADFNKIKSEDIESKSPYYKELFDKELIESIKGLKTKEDIDEFIKNNQKFKKKKYLYRNEPTYIFIQYISKIRQWCFHGYALNLSQYTSNKNFLVSKELANINKTFASSNQKYFKILKELKATKIIDVDDVYLEWYKYLYSPEYKSLGISYLKIKKLVFQKYKEKDEYQKIDSKLLAEFNNKFSHVLNFIIILYYSNNHEEMEKVKEALKSSADDNEKELIYINLSEEFINRLNLSSIKKAIVNHLGKNSKENEIVNISKYEQINIKSTFIKILYEISVLLTKKQALEMYSCIINKIENLEEFSIFIDNNTPIADNIKTNFKFDTEFVNFKTQSLRSFKDELKMAKAIREKLKINIHDKSLSKGKRFLLEDAYYSLGGLEDKLGDFKKALSFNSEFKEDTSSKKFRPIANFINNNIIKSKYYNYVRQYCSPSFCKDIIKQDSIILFILNDINKKIPDYLLKIYKNNFTVNSDLSILKDEPIIEIKDELKKINYDAIYESISNNDRLKNFIQLYYYVIYLFIKNLVRINYQHSLSILEYETLYNSLKLNSKNVSYDLSLTDIYFTETINKKTKAFKEAKKIRTSFPDTLCKQSSFIWKQYRNIIVHINLFPDNCDFKISGPIKSYFGLYTHFTQLAVLERIQNINCIDLLSFISNIKDDLEKYKSKSIYSKRFNQFLNLPYLYNMSRYKVMTVENLYKKFKD